MKARLAIESQDQKSHFAVRGAIAATTATVLLMGGFGAFALWQDNVTLATTGENGLVTGSLELTVDEAQTNPWTFKGDDATGAQDGIVAANTPISPDSFKVSPGDILQWHGVAHVKTVGDDMRAQLGYDEGSIIDFVLHPNLTGLVDIDVAYGAPGNVIEGTKNVDIPVTVTVTFSRDIKSKDSQTLGHAVNLDGLALTLTQLAGPANP